MVKWGLYRRGTWKDGALDIPVKDHMGMQSVPTLPYSHLEQFVLVADCEWADMAADSGCL